MMRPDPEVAALEHGKLRLYGLAEPERDAALLRAEIEAAREGNAALPLAARLLGAERLDARWLDLIRVADLGELGLSDYLAAGYDVPSGQLDAARRTLEAAPGHVLVVPSRAFDGTAQTLAPDAALVPLVALENAAQPEPTTPLPPAGGPPQKTAPPSPPAEPAPGGPRPGLVLTAVLVAAALVLILAMTLNG